MLNVFFLIEIEKSFGNSIYSLVQLLKLINLTKYELIFINISSEKLLLNTFLNCVIFIANVQDIILHK